jgi:hypothetical protein
MEEEKILLPGQSPQGEYILAVLVKRTYSIGAGGLERVEAKLVKGDKHYGDPRTTPVEFEADLVPFKLATDVVVNAKAYAPDGRPAREVRCGVRVGPVAKDLVVIGDRTAMYRANARPVFTEPAPFTEMLVTYDRAYGGVDIRSDPEMPYPYPRNPLGRGFAVKNTKAAVDGLALPNIEDARVRLAPEALAFGDYAAWEKQPMPQGFGWFPKVWYPRAPLAGILPADRPIEEQMRRELAQVVPPEQRQAYLDSRLPDMDFRFFNGASQGLVAPFLAGNEDVVTEGLVPEGRLAFKLPGERPKMALDIGSGPTTLEVVLHTVTIRVEHRQVDLVWRGAMPYPGPDWFPQMKKLEIDIQ